MKLEDQVVSLELAKRLKELGVKQESIWYYWQSNILGNPWLIDTVFYEKSIALMLLKHQPERTISAFTVAELGEMLPNGYYTFKDETGWYGEKWIKLDQEIISDANTEADARAKMLIHLIEKGIVNP